MRDAEKAMSSIVDHLVIGGGPAGSMAASRLARAGREVVLVEKERGPHHKVCGEFLSQESMEYLEQMGIDLLALGAVSIERVRLHARRRVAEQQLPFRAMSLSRRALDEAMLERANAFGCEVRRGIEVESVTREGELWRTAIRGAEPLWAREIFLATGKHDVRGWGRDRGKQADFVGFKMHWHLRPAQIAALRGVMELFLFPGGYGGMSLVEGDVATLCFVVRRERLQECGGWSGLVDEVKRANVGMRERLEGGETLYERPLAISAIPYGHLPGEDRGVWCLGDQAAVIPSFTGDGMSIALHSGASAAEMSMAGMKICAYNETLRAQLKGGMRLAMMLSRMMVTEVGRQAAPLAMTLVPQAMRWVARGTRIPDKALKARGRIRPVASA
jgi:flavin-dependent dehydrogenase